MSGEKNGRAGAPAPSGQEGEIERLRRRVADLRAEAAEPLPRAKPSPAYKFYVLGGSVTAAGGQTGDLLPLAGFMALPVAAARAAMLAAGGGHGRFVLRDLLPAIRGDRVLTERGIQALQDFERPWTARTAATAASHTKRELGRVFADHGFDWLHGRALDGAFSLGAHRLADNCQDVASSQDQQFGAALFDLIVTHFAALDARGGVVHHRRGAAAYERRCVRFAERERTHPRAWRGLLPTRKQNWTLIDTAQQRGADIPGFSTRGEAAETLEEMGAIIKYRKEDVS